MSAPAVEGSLLALVIDADPVAWGLRGEQLQDGPKRFADVLDDILIFINAFLLLSGRNRVVVVAGYPGGSKIIYPLPPPTPSTPLDTAQAGAAAAAAAPDIFELRPSICEVAKRLGEGVRSLGASASASAAGGESGVSQRVQGSRPPRMAEAMSRALCVVNRLCPPSTAAKASGDGVSLGEPANTSSAPAPLRPRMLVIGCAPDDGSQYRAVMNCVFAAQRLAAPIDACFLGQQHSAFLQQAAHISGGGYIHPFGTGSENGGADGGAAKRQRQGAGAATTGDLYQHLVAHFLADARTRQLLHQPSGGSHSLDLRPACFKTNKIIDIGFVCSVCLSIFSQEAAFGSASGTGGGAMAVCETCGTRFGESSAAARNKRRR